MTGDVPKAGDDAAALARGLEPSGFRVPVLLVFWKRNAPFGDWRCTQFRAEDVEAAKLLAKKRGTQVVASFVDVPRFLVEGW